MRLSERSHHRRRRFRRRLSLAVFAAVVATWPNDGEARPRGRVKKRAGQFVEAALQPTLQSFWSGANHFASDLDGRLAGRLDQVHGITSSLVNQGNEAVADRIDQVDARLEARLLQIDASAQHLVDNAIGGVDKVARDNIARATTSGKSLIRELDTTAQSRLAQVDEILAARLDDVDAIVDDAIRGADKAMEARIAQIDETLERQLANVDTLASKQALGIERALGRVILVAAAAGFCVAALLALWRRRRQACEAIDAEPTRDGRPSAHDRQRQRNEVWMRKFVLPGLAVLVGAAGVAAAGIMVLDRTTLGGGRERDALADDYTTGFRDALAKFEFAKARVYAGRLAIFDPERAQQDHVSVAKADLFRLVFSRPTALATPENEAAVRDQIRVLEQELGDETDPDLHVIRCLVTWRTGTTRDEEHRAASACARALRQASAPVLAPLARSTITAFLHQPFVPGHLPVGRHRESLASLQRLAYAVDGEPEDFPLAHVTAFNELVRALDRDATAAYLDLLAAQARVETTAAPPSPPPQSRRRRPRRDATAMPVVDPARAAAHEAALGDRQKAATRLRDAWRRFDAALTAAPKLEQSASVLAVFRLNDVVLSHAWWYLEQPTTTARPPRLDDVTSPELRVQVAPIRIAWAKRYADLLGSHAQPFIELEEASRYWAFEDATLDFEAQLLDTLAAALMRSNAACAGNMCTPQEQAQRVQALIQGPSAAVDRDVERWLDIGIAAAELGLYIDTPHGRVPFAAANVPDVAQWLSRPVAPLGPARPSQSQTTKDSTLDARRSTLRDALTKRVPIFL